MADQKQDDATKDTTRLPHAAPTVTADPQHRESPFGAPGADPKPDGVKAPKSPQQKAADTRAKNKRKADREERKAAKAEEQEAQSAESRTWSCPQCGRGVTLLPDQQPPTIMRCEGCGKDSMGDTWLPPGAGHGEPTLQVPPIH